MKCPFCGFADSRVVDSRPTDEDSCIRRRRECLHCHHRFTTYEQVELLPIIVVKRDGSRESFDRAKLLNGLIKSCEKRPVSLHTLESLVTEIELQLQNQLEREVPSSQIGEMVMERLKQVDEISYVRFASVYRQFTDVSSFLQELQQLVQDQKGEREEL